MPRVQVKGLDDLLPMYKGLENDTRAILKKGVYDGAKELADSLNAAIATLPVQNGSEKGGKKKAINILQKKGLQESMGISKMQSDDYSVWVSIGFDGFNSIKTHTWPQGQPNQMIARSLEKGTEYLAQKRFVRPIINKSKARAIEKMKKTIINNIKERTK